MTCTVCGSPIPDAARFCPSCGAPVHAALATEERRIVTVLFADLVDSTGLSQRLDPERSRELLGRFYDAASEELQALRGRPEKFIGDAVMAVFGLPQTSEDDAVRAIRAGLAIRDRVARLGEELGLADALRVRVGVASGEAATGTGPSGQSLVTGPVVNAAARLQSAAEPGEVLAGNTTVALTRDAVGYGPGREVEAKGFAGGLHGHPVGSLSPRSVRRTIPFVGRTSELAILRESAALAATRGRPVLATILGEPGVGKSRLADELLAGLPEDTAVLIGRDQSIADTTTFAPIAAMVRDLAGGTDPGDSEEHGDPAEADATDTVRISARVREIVDACCDPNEVSLVVERLGLLFGETEGREATSFVQDVQAGFLALIDGLAAQGPVILVFEDVHMLRPPMLDLVERIARGRHRVRGGPAGPGAVLTLAMARPELLDERPAWGTGAANAVRLHLEPLGIDEATSLADQAAGARIDRHAAERIARRTGGNPFFIVETTGMLMGAEGSEEVLPPTVQAVVAARLDALPAPLRELARRASVFLVDFDLPELRVVGAEDLDSIAALEDAEILVRGEEGEGPWWRFRHETLRQVAYASLPKRERRLLHERVADHLEAAGHPTFAADHLEAAAIAAADVDPTDRALPERAAEALAEAGHRARRRMENRTAVDAYRRALAVIGPEAGWGTREARALAGAGEARYWLSDYAGATADLERALELGTALGDDWTLTHALRFLGDIAINVHADLERAEDLLARSLDAAERLGDPRAIARTLLFAGWVPWTRDSYGDAERPWRRALEIAQTEHDRWAEVRALTALSINATNLGDYDEATALIDRGTAVAADMGDAFSEAVTTVQRGRIHEDLGRFDEAIACFDDAIDRFADLGARWELADALAERGICNRETGRLDEAETDLRQAIRLSEELGERQLAGWTWRAYAAVAERRGDTSEAAERARRAAEAASRAPR